jgi:malate dehydrogenase (oxaloacetate-decarboxylating)(NADP+)
MKSGTVSYLAVHLPPSEKRLLTMEQKKIRREDALEYHSKGRPGKIAVVPTKETANQRDLSLAYSPGVAEPCLAIKENREDVYKYTAKGNLVAVITNGTAVLGLGDIGPEAAKPVMEGKGVLFKIYADIDVFDIEINTKDVDKFVETVKMLEPTFGGVNLEDIKAPECFEIERRLRAEMQIPVMHDDQHGTAIISGAALMNALEIVGKEPGKVRLVVSGAGAAAISCVRLYLLLGVKKENVVMFDIDGLLHPDRPQMDATLLEFASRAYPKEAKLADAMVGADVFLGLSVKKLVTPDMVRSMAADPIVFAMANPDPEITYPEAMESRDDLIMATGRTDYPNQVNNVLGFPYIFRGALDVRATEITEGMKLAAAAALADLAKKPVPDIVNMAYHESNLHFGRTYIIPKPMDPRLLTTVAPAVAKAAMSDGVAQQPIRNWDEYALTLEKRLGLDHQISKAIIKKAAQGARKTVVFADAENLTVLKAIQQCRDENICDPVLLGDVEAIQRIIHNNSLDLEDINIIDTRSPEDPHIADRYAELFFEKRKRKGIVKTDALKMIRKRNYFGAMMVETGDADALISGLTRSYPDTIRPALEIIGRQEGVQRIAGMYILMTQKGPLFLADTTVNINPTAEEIVEVAELTARGVQRFGITPRIALVTYSSFGSAQGDDAVKMRKATGLLQQKHPDWIVEGEMQAHLAFNMDLVTENYPFSKISGENANTIIFPNLSASNIAYNLLKETANIEYIGPILLGIRKPVHVLQLGSTVREIVNMVAIAVVEAQRG